MDEKTTNGAGGVLASTLSALGISCEFIGEDLTPNAIIYHFILNDLKDLPKVKKSCASLSARFHKDIRQAPSECGDFALSVKRSSRAVIHFSTAFAGANLSPCEAVIGQSASGDFVKLSLDKMISALCVGASGSGKSTFLHTFINSLACSTSADKLGFLMIDCKRAELVRYNAISHHLICMVCTDAGEANKRLNQVINIMQERCKIMEERGINICPEDFSRIVIIVDELAELMLSTDKQQAENTKKALIRLCQMGRACGIHCLLCTQSPRVAVVDGLIQTNTPTKFALRTANARESVIAIGHGGCESLFGRGDMLFKPADDVREIRLQVPYISSDDISALYEHLPKRDWKKSHRKPKFWERVKTALTLQDCIDYDIVDDED